MALSQRARIVGLGTYLPSQEMTNRDMEKIVDTTDEWIFSRTGIRARRFAGSEEFTSTMGVLAAQEAIKNAHLTLEQIDLIVVATMSSDYPSPSTASLIQHLLGAPHTAAMDIQAACSGFVYALSTAKAYVECGMARHALVIASEKMSSLLDFTDRSTCVLFGDGASAAVVSGQGTGLAIKSVKMGSDGSLAHLVIIPAGGARLPATLETVAQRQHYFKMSGRELFKHAVRKAVSAAESCLQAEQLSVHAIDWMVPHQANQRIMNAIAKGMDLPEEKVFSVIDKYGNTSAAGIGIALKELVDAHPLHHGQNILLNAFGGGLTWASALLTQETDGAL